MQKVYLLLRSNKQTGPYSLEELLQLNLKPFDLVWVQGRSAAWQYPFEIPSLKPFVPETPQTNMPFQPIATSVMEEKPPREVTQVFKSESLSQPPAAKKAEAPKRVFVSVPDTHISENRQRDYAEQSPYAPKPPSSGGTEEKIKTDATSYSQSATSYHKEKPDEEKIHTNYSRSLNEVEEDYSTWTYQQKTKRKASVNPKDLVLAALILTVIGGGYYVMSKPSVANSVLPANKAVTETPQQPTESQPQTIGSNETASAGQAMVTAGDVTIVTEPKVKTTKTKNPLAVPQSQTNSSVPSAQSSMPVEKTNPNIQGDNEVITKEPSISQQPQAKAPAEKKTKFREIIKGIFSKKDKKEEPKKNETVSDEPKPSNNRQATRRDEDNKASDDNSVSSETNTANLMQQIDISSNASDNWMMGVKNLKVTLRNRSNTPIQKASVAVNYYDENNRLLEKKLIYFSNVAPKAKTTVGAPDHKFADHVDFSLTSVSANEDRYASY